MKTHLIKILTFGFFLISAPTLLAWGENVKVEYDYHFFTPRGYEVNRGMILNTFRRDRGNCMGCRDLS